jgi:NitT/TauT family transport system substrate-binding protein
MRRRTLIKSSALFGLGAVGTSLFSSCVQSNSDSSSNPIPNTNTSTNTNTSNQLLRVGVLNWFGCEGMLMADKKNLFAAEGIKVEQKYFASPTEINDLFLAGKLDLAAMVATDPIMLTLKMPDIKTIYVTDYSGDVDGILASKKIMKPEDLRGKKVACEDVPYELIFLGEFLKLGGMTAKDVQIVSLTAEEGAKAFAAGKVDAVVTYDPYLGKALKQRVDAHQLFSAKASNIIPNAIVAQSKVIESKRNDLLAYIRAVDKGLKFSAANRKEADNLMAKWLAVGLPEIADQRSKIYILDIVKNKVDAFNLSSPLNVESSIRSGGKILLENGKVKKLAEAGTLVDSSLIKSL